VVRARTFIFIKINVLLGWISEKYDNFQGRGGGVAKFFGGVIMNLGRGIIQITNYQGALYH
jgi:hypothetical protein